jgi:hypothetical protein
MDIIIDKIEDNERNIKLKHVYSTLIAMFNTYDADFLLLKTKFKLYLENQNNELKKDRIFTNLSNLQYFQSIDKKEAEILRSYMPCFIYHVDNIKTYNETIDEFSNIPVLMYNILNIFYIEEYKTIYKLIEINLKNNLALGWCIII